jgi:hypothetical protein
MVTLIIGLAGKFRIDQWLMTGIAPLIPVLILGLRQSAEQKEAAERLDALRRHAERMWNDILAGESAEEATQQARELQDEIFDHRRRNPLIFDWIYNLLRNRQEEQMNKAASALIEQARSKTQFDSC